MKLKSSRYGDRQIVELLLQYTQSVREARQIDNQIKAPRGMLNLIRHTDLVNLRRMVFEMHHAVERDCRTFGMGKRTGFAGPKSVTAVEVHARILFFAFADVGREMKCAR